MTTSILDRFRTLDSAAVSDALDALGLPSGVSGLRPFTVPARVIGFARTALLEPREEGTETGAHILTDVVDAAGDDDVIVIDNGGRLDVSAWGGILGLGASARGVRGVIVDGAFRDVEENCGHGLAVYARGTVPATARGRLQQRSVGQTVRIAGRKVHQGDLVIADATGFAVVPRAYLEAVAAQAEAVARREEAIAAEVAAGKSLQEAMRDARLSGQEEVE